MSNNAAEIDVFAESSKPQIPSNNNSFRVNTQSLPLGSRSIGSSVVINNNSNKVDSIKTWGVSTLKCTKQIIQEKLGKASKTIDIDLEDKIEKLRDLQRRYRRLYETINKLYVNFQEQLTYQRNLAEQFSELGQQQPELINEFSVNSDLQRHLIKQGEPLNTYLGQLVECLNTLVSKTMSDTLQTIQRYEKSRVEFDAYRHEVTEMNKLSKSTDPASVAKAMELKERMLEKQNGYNQLRMDVDIKIKFLEENKNRVLHRHLVLFNQAIVTYYSGKVNDDNTALNQLTSLHLSMKNANFDTPSWLENIPLTGHNNTDSSGAQRSHSFNTSHNSSNHNQHNSTTAYTPH